VNAILTDNDGGYPEECLWVSTHLTSDPTTAERIAHEAFPIADSEMPCFYVCESKAYYAPYRGTGQEEFWRECSVDHPDSEEFWYLSVSDEYFPDCQRLPNYKAA